jgi:hypothetical protein
LFAKKTTNANSESEGEGNGSDEGSGEDINEDSEDGEEEEDYEDPEDGEFTLSEGEAERDSTSDIEVSDGESDGPGCDKGHGYGDLENDKGARFKVNISTEDHQTYCGCDLAAEDSPHCLSVHKSGVVEITEEEHKEFCGCDLDANDSPHSRSRDTESDDSFQNEPVIETIVDM